MSRWLLALVLLILCALVAARTVGVFLNLSSLTSPLLVDYDDDPPPEDPAAAKVAEPEEKIIQKMFRVKKFTKAQEVALACKEVDCVKDCSDKASEKCSASEHCIKDKVAKCRKTCALERCAERCKNEPDVSYVARELKLEKCTEKCDDVNEEDRQRKCKAKCEDEAKTCKVRCKEKLRQIVCVRSLDLLNVGDEDLAQVEALADDKIPI